MKKLMIALVVIFGLTACEDITEKRKNTEGITKVEEVAGDYITYYIEEGAVKCKEHKGRSELACWSVK